MRLGTVQTYNAGTDCTSGGPGVNTKLTLRLDEELIRRAKRHAGKSGKSVSKLVADYFALIDAGTEVPGTEITPRVRSLIGSLKGAAVTDEDYRRHLEEKYR